MKTLARITLLALLAGAMTYYAASLNKAAAAIQGKSAPNSVTSSSTFSNPAAITINDSASPPTTATPYSSNIAVSGAGPVTKLTVTLTNVSHAFPDDIDVLLVGPTGQSAILMSDAGGGGSISNVTLTFDDAAASSLPDAPQIVTGTYVPTNYGGGDTFPGPAPAPPYGASLSVFNGRHRPGLGSTSAMAFPSMAALTLRPAISRAKQFRGHEHHRFK